MLKMTEERQSAEELPAKPGLDFGEVCAHLANERTFLSWICTSILLMGCGIAVAKLRIAISDFSQTSGTTVQSTGQGEISPITMGMGFLMLGMFTLLIATYRYLAIQTRLRKHKYYVDNLHILIFFVALLILGGTLILHVLQLRESLL